MKKKTIYKLKSFILQIRETAPKPLGAIDGPDSTVPILRHIFATLDVEQEHFVMLALNNCNVITGFKVCHSGGQSATMVDPKIVFRSALLLGASGIIISHNHPGGNPKPSPEDIRVTNQLRRAGEILGIRVLDHIIVAGNEYCSMEAEHVGGF